MKLHEAELGRRLRDLLIEKRDVQGVNLAIWNDDALGITTLSLLFVVDQLSLCVDIWSSGSHEDEEFVVVQYYRLVFILQLGCGSDDVERAELLQLCGSDV